MIQGTVTDGDITSNTDWDPITAKQLAKPSGKIILEKNLQKLQRGGNKVLILSQMVCVLEFLRIYCASNSPNMKGSMDQSLPKIRLVLFIGLSHIISKLCHDIENKISRAGACLTCSRKKSHF